MNNQYLKYNPVFTVLYLILNKFKNLKYNIGLVFSWVLKCFSITFDFSVSWKNGIYNIISV
ncbi:Hypothetical protein ERWE_CDS_07680 [Ehrlichia ruminantium str. Welgevonden]|uniref:Uncharacterized protein n=1 Tax=Ehrlichia ruminantium (strain Welgevonden) TaxID=254945 RepID=A0A0H3M6N1_EHRRW|nr:Hypothetical protein ERWE_CDS_07680 [Ehrlichia ruminantium str. Welgevonden]